MTVQKQLVPMCEVQVGPSKTVLGDSTWLRQSLLNLLSNAIEFTQKGGVHITMVATAADDSRVALRVGSRTPALASTW